jgi:hypothetical protein
LRHSGAVRLANGVFAVFTTDTDPPGQPNQVTATSVGVFSNVIHRVLVDEEHGVYFGYDLEAEPVAQTKQLQVSVKPLDPEYAQRLRESPWWQSRRPAALP